MLFEATFVGAIAGQQCINRFNYQSLEEPSTHLGSFALSHALGAYYTGDPSAIPAGTVCSYLLTVLSTDFTLQTVVIKAIYDDLDFFDAVLVPPAHGYHTEHAPNAFTSFGFRTSRIRQDIRRGTKRFAGVPQNAVNDASGSIVGSYPSELVTLGGAMSELLVDDSTADTLHFVPTVCQRQTTIVDGKKHISYYPDEATQMEHSFQNFVWEHYENVRTQVSRQIGKGK